MDHCFHVFIFLTPSFSKICRPKLEKKLPDVRKNREFLVQAFGSTACLLPIRGKVNETHLIFRRHLKYRASLTGMKARLRLLQFEKVLTGPTPRPEFLRMELHLDQEDCHD